MDRSTAVGWKSAIKSFRRALDMDPSNALAYAAMAESYSLLAYWAYMRTNEAVPIALALSKQAIRVDHNSPEAHSSMGLASLIMWDWQCAYRELGHAIALSPTLACARMYLSWCLAAMGDVSAAIDQGTIACNLEPLSRYVSTSLGTLYMCIEDYDSAFEVAYRALTLNPEAATVHYSLSAVYTGQKSYDKAAEHLAEGLCLDGRQDQAARIQESYARGGFEGMLRTRIAIDARNTYEEYDPYQVAISYAQLRDTERTIQWLNKAYQVQAGILLLQVDSNFSQLRSDRRYCDLLHGMGLSTEPNVIGHEHSTKQRSMYDPAQRPWGLVAPGGSESSTA